MTWNLVCGSDENYIYKFEAIAQKLMSRIREVY